MAKHTESSDEETSSSGAEEQNPQVGGGGVTEYERQRQARIAHNKARMEALGLPQMASSLMGSAQNAAKRSRKGKAKVLVEEEDDEEYRPEEEDDEEYRPEEEGYGSSSEEEVDDDDDFEDEEVSGKYKRKGKGAKRKNAHARSSFNSSDYLDDDEALKQAIALSLQGPIVSGVANVNDRKRENQIQQDTGRKRKNAFASRMQMTEDELVLHFYQLDERCTGGISARDLEKAAIAHDFTWTDKEVADMIRLFDSDGDAKLSLEDFRKIVVRCNIIKTPENS